MPKVLEIKIYKCHECPFFRKGFLSEPSECGKFPAYTAFLEANCEPPSWCPLDEKQERLDEMEKCALLCEELAKQATNRDLQQGMMLCAAFIRKKRDKEHNRLSRN